MQFSFHSGLPIIPTDLFPRELSDITGVRYSRIKIGFDITCLAVTAGLTFFCLGRIKGLGIGTILAAFTMGKGIALIGGLIDKKFVFENFLTLRKRRRHKNNRDTAVKSCSRFFCFDILSYQPA